MITSLMTKAVLEGYVSGLEANDCLVKRRGLSGTVEVYDDDNVVLQALEKGYGQPWIVRFYESDRIKWTLKETPTDG